MKKRSRGTRQWPRMTPEQQQLAADNHNLIYAYLSRSGYDPDDFYDVAAIGLCKAAMTYIPERGKFTTYAYRCMKTEVSHDLVTQSRACRSPAVPLASLNAPIGESRDSLELSDLLSSEADFTRPEVEEILSKLPQKYADDIRQYMNGATKSEVSHSHGYTAAAFGERMKVVKRLIAEMNLDV